MNFGLHAAAFQFGERGVQHIHAHAAVVERNADRVDAEPLEPRQRALIVVLLDDDGVAVRQQRAVDQIERLQRTRHDQDVVGGAGHAGIALELLAEKIAQRPVALRPAVEAIGRQRAALARQHRLRGRHQPVERHRVGVVIAAGEIEFGQTGPARGRRRQPGRKQRAEVECHEPAPRRNLSWPEQFRPRQEKCYFAATTMISTL